MNDTTTSSVVYRIAAREGSTPLCEYSSPREAYAAIGKLLEIAEEKAQAREEWLLEHPLPWNDDTAIKAMESGITAYDPLENFANRGLSVTAVPAKPQIIRFNVSASEDPSILGELEMKMLIFGHCDIYWTCTGRTLEYILAESTMREIEKNHGEWKVWLDNGVVKVASGESE